MASLDIDLDPIAELHLAVGKLSDKVDKAYEELRRQPDYLSIAGTVLYSTAAGVVNFIDLGCPSAGRRWEVKNLMVGGSDITTTPTGTAWIVKMAIPPTAAVPLTVVKDFTSGTFPQNAFYGGDELTLIDNQHLYIIITGGANNTQYTATAEVRSYKQYVRTV